MDKAAYTRTLEKYLTPEWAHHIADLYYDAPQLHLVVKNARSSKLGDFRAAAPGKKLHQISVNHDLPRYKMAVVLLHELAHYRIYLRHAHRVKPHGAEWRTEFRGLLHAALEKGLFPQKIALAIRRDFFSHNYIGQLSCPELDEREVLQVKALPMGAVFAFRGVMLKRMEQRRTRFVVLEVPGGRRMVLHGDAEVEHVFADGHLIELPKPRRRLGDCAVGKVFGLQGRRFRVDAHGRSRSKCTELASGKQFYIQMSTEIDEK